MLAWILVLMVALQPEAPWIATYTGTARAIAEAAEREPIFDGDDGPERTAALLVALAWFESRFQADAIGDASQSFGLYQISRVHAPALELVEPIDATTHALRLLRQSMAICAKRPMVERLGWYAAGGPGCDHAHDKSRHRMQLAQRLLREHPPDAAD